MSCIFSQKWRRHKSRRKLNYKLHLIDPCLAIDKLSRNSDMKTPSVSIFSKNGGGQPIIRDGTESFLARMVPIDIEFRVARDRRGRRRAAKGRKSRKGTHRARVWSINHVVPGDRWTLGSMETPHNWENSAGLLVDRAHGHLSCRDRAPIDGSARFELTPVKSRVARLGKSAPFDLSRLHTRALAPRDRYRTAPFFYSAITPLCPCTS